MRKDAFDEREADFYEALYTQSQAQFGAYVQAGTVVNNYAHIFDLLIRLRQVCLPPQLHQWWHLHPHRKLSSAKCSKQSMRHAETQRTACCLCKMSIMR